MSRFTLLSLLSVLHIFLAFNLVLTEELTEDEPIPLSKVSVEATRIAQPHNIYSFDQAISALRYDPQVDLQERGFGEVQGDVSIRGGIFENSGFEIGAATLFDPQTGHYFAEIPIPAFMLTAPQVLTGVDNAVRSFNSSVATIAYGWQPIEQQSVIRIGGGNNGYNLQEVFGGHQNILDSKGDYSLNLELSFSRSQTNGTRINGDALLARYGGRVQLTGPDLQTDLYFGQQTKDFSWPYLYAPQELHELLETSGIESEDLRTSLVFLNHSQSYGNASSVTASAYYRRNRDDYEFDRFDPGLFNEFRHTTEVFSAGVNGIHQFDQFFLRYDGQILHDEIDSTALTFGGYNKRTYGQAAVTPGFSVPLSDMLTLTTEVGAALATTSQNATVASPVGRLSIRRESPTSIDTYEEGYIEYSEATQFPGYTAIASNPDGGLFRGSSDLLHERSKNLETGFRFGRESLQGQVALFYRQDDNLVDWIFDASTTTFSARRATNVDINTYGAEGLVTWRVSPILTTVGSYTYLDKDEDYGEDAGLIDGSFYALNYARHRATAGFILSLLESLELRFDSEFRNQVQNPLRNTSNRKIFGNLALVAHDVGVEGLVVLAGVDNIWNENFEEVPGVPSRRRQVSSSITYTW